LIAYFDLVVILTYYMIAFFLIQRLPLVTALNCSSAILKWICVAESATAIWQV